MIEYVLRNTKIVLIVIIFLSSACTNTRKENNTTNEFYTSLHSQINEGDFISPLEISQAGKQEQHKNISFTAIPEGIEYIADSESYKVFYSPISVIKTRNGKQKDAGYSIKLHFKDGTTKTINRLQKPQKNEN